MYFRFSSGPCYPAARLSTVVALCATQCVSRQTSTSNHYLLARTLARVTRTHYPLAVMLKLKLVYTPAGAAEPVNETTDVKNFPVYV